MEVSKIIVIFENENDKNRCKLWKSDDYQCKNDKNAHLGIFRGQKKRLILKIFKCSNFQNKVSFKILKVSKILRNCVIIGSKY